MHDEAPGGSPRGRSDFMIGQDSGRGRGDASRDGRLALGSALGARPARSTNGVHEGPEPIGVEGPFERDVPGSGLSR